MPFIGPQQKGSEYGLAIMLSADLKRLDAGLKQANKSINEMNENMIARSQKATAKMDDVFGKGFKRIARLAAAAFSIDAIAGFSRESVLMAANLEGVEIAFKRIGGLKVMDDLQRATRGTVNDLKLMQLAVQASNFQIPLEQLGSLFEFARRRAKETGLSVDYLVESIVTGIGRKSPLILDNLGISAVELRKRLEGVGMESASVGDMAKIVGAIAQEELSKMGEESETTSDKIQRLAASWDNLKISAGAAIIDATDGLSNIGQTIGELFSGEAFEFAKVKATYEELERGLGRALTATEKLRIEGQGFTEEQKKLIRSVRDGTIAINEGRVAADEWAIKAAAARGEGAKWADAFSMLNEEAKETPLSLEDATKAAEKATLAFNNLRDAETSAGIFGGDIVGPNVNQLTIPDEAAEMAEEFENAQEAVEDLTGEAKKFFEQQKVGLEGMQQMGMLISNSFANAFASILDGTATIDDALKRLLADLTAAIVRILVLRGIMAALTGGASEASGAASIISGAVSQGMGVGRFANGGIISGPTLGLVGEYAGARTNPEVIAPLDKLKSLLGSSDMGMSASVRVSGEDLVIMLQKAGSRLERKRGF